MSPAAGSCSFGGMGACSISVLRSASGTSAWAENPIACVGPSDSRGRRVRPKARPGRFKFNASNQLSSSMRLVIFGPPGVGKGTYSERISKRYNIPHIATGDILRDEMSRKTELGEKVRLCVERGYLVPDEVVNQIVRKRIAQPECKGGFILDGYPRTIAQAEALDKMARIDVVINLQVPEPIIVKRLSARRICARCGAIYNLVSLPPKEPGHCDKCRGELYRREDDEPEVIKNRLKEYGLQTGPLLERYQEKSMVKNVSLGEKDVDTAVKLIFDLLEK